MFIFLKIFSFRSLVDNKYRRVQKTLWRGVKLLRGVTPRTEGFHLRFLNYKELKDRRSQFLIQDIESKTEINVGHFLIGFFVRLRSVDKTTGSDKVSSAKTPVVTLVIEGVTQTTFKPRPSHILDTKKMERSLIVRKIRGNCSGNGKFTRSQLKKQTLICTTVYLSDCCDPKRILLHLLSAVIISLLVSWSSKT